MKILIAEDDPVSSRILQKNLENWDYETVLARSGPAAWQSLQDESMRLAILDWMMPGMDGVEVCRKIRRRRKYKYTYIILLSAKDRKQDIIAGLSSGADDYMTKPVNFLELRARLKTGRRIIDLEDKLLFIQNQLKDLASRDSLTRIWNRAEITRFLSEEVERGRREKKPTSVIMLDVDHFKKINDFYGHSIGDQALLQVVARLRRNVRRSDKIGRYGGDEIIVILPNCGQVEVWNIGERLRRAVGGRNVRTEFDSVPVTVSAGCATLNPGGPPSPEALIKSADRALLKAKEKGRNCVVLAGDGHESIREQENARPRQH
jgi:diguanylate cyclase (GGDEF)-like protein